MTYMALICVLKTLLKTFARKIAAYAIFFYFCGVAKKTKAMKKEELVEFGKQYAGFVGDCKRVVRELSRYNKNPYSFCDFFYIEGDTVCAEGDELFMMGGCTRHSCDFPLDLLSYTDEELSRYVDKMIAKRDGGKHA